MNLQSNIVRSIQLSFSSPHQFLLTLGGIISLVYSVSWLKTVGLGIWHGSSDSVLNFGLIALAGKTIWHKRMGIKRQTAVEVDQILGHSIALCGILIFPFIYNSVSLQSIVFVWIIIGLSLSHWGVSCFSRNWKAVTMLLIAAYPNLNFIAVRIFRFFTPDMGLERLMALLGSHGLQIIGQAATAQAQYLNLPEGSVEVAFGCSGFAMAFTLGGCGLLIGLFFKLATRETASLVFIGVLIALSLNVPRIMLLANAAVYWGAESFDFWHGTWGGQIFSSAMFTAYYYTIMWFLEKKTR